MSDPGPAITRFAFSKGELRGTHLTLYPTCVQHRSDSYLETLPLSGITAVRVAFERHPRGLTWGVVLIVIALVLLAVAGPTESWASRSAVETAKSEGVGRLLHTVAVALVAFASLSPVIALACAIGGGALCTFGWLGRTTLVVSLPGAERIYATRGRDSTLLDFAEALSERLTAPKR